MARYGAPSWWERNLNLRRLPAEREPEMTVRELCAYHEAGHAVLASRAGLSIEEITVNDHGKGRCRIKLAERSFEDLGWLENEMVMFWAGAIAQDRVWGGGRESRAGDRGPRAAAQDARNRDRGRALCVPDL